MCAGVRQRVQIFREVLDPSNKEEEGVEGTEEGDDDDDDDDDD
eukprot:CAMPEP_0175059206 /NCGR_PEP_ID=MMETSP0052_2-20121109/12298_1 /TAXON_ID=51329 ORGANISM="Polytomella parva, Strain SAG 63-3" /NCGR_SAMPLE_ID=MMETSP0052_2 /ASSEMBLY_ACC=CAM_ASM_000194 /LENGTH=42 /DNA_ID= /DNA_START= /DNA_END= /DNA_ORIENTATION=